MYRYRNTVKYINLSNCKILYKDWSWLRSRHVSPWKKFQRFSSVFFFLSKGKRKNLSRWQFIQMKKSNRVKKNIWIFLYFFFSFVNIIVRNYGNRLEISWMTVFVLLVVWFASMLNAFNSANLYIEIWLEMMLYLLFLVVDTKYKQPI